MEALTEVGVPCRHPGTPHEGHTIYLRPHLGLEAGLAAEAVLVDVNRDLPANSDTPEDDPIWARRQAEIMRRWLPIFVRHGAAGWDLASRSTSRPCSATTASPATWPTWRATCTRPR
jgi:hypothetical protein